MFWRDVEQELGSKLGSLDLPWASVKYENDKTFLITFWVGRRTPVLSLSHDGNRASYEVLSPCCASDLRIVKKRLACRRCEKPLSTRLTDIRTSYGDADAALLQEWLELTLDPLETVIVQEPLTRWLDLFLSEYHHAVASLSRASGRREAEASLAERASGPLTVLTASNDFAEIEG